MTKYFNLLERYHQELSSEKLEIFEKLFEIYFEINKKINLISRKDFENFYLHHIIHSLSITKFDLIKKNNTKIIDLGTGGGFPGIPLVDSIKKKINAVNNIIKKINLKNTNCINDRAENLNENADVIISRSVSSVDNIIEWTKSSLKTNGKLILLKGGNVNKELKNIRSRFTIYKLDDIYSDNYFTDKKIIEIHK